MLQEINAKSEILDESNDDSDYESGLDIQFEINQQQQPKQQQKLQKQKRETSITLQSSEPISKYSDEKTTRTKSQLFTTTVATVSSLSSTTTTKSTQSIVKNIFKKNKEDDNAIIIEKSTDNSISNVKSLSSSEKLPQHIETKNFSNSTSNISETNGLLHSSTNFNLTTNSSVIINGKNNMNCVNSGCKEIHDNNNDDDADSEQNGCKKRKLNETTSKIIDNEKIKEIVISSPTIKTNQQKHSAIVYVDERELKRRIRNDQNNALASSLFCFNIDFYLFLKNLKRNRNQREQENDNERLTKSSDKEICFSSLIPSYDSKIVSNDFVAEYNNFKNQNVNNNVTYDDKINRKNDIQTTQKQQQHHNMATSCPDMFDISDGNLTHKVNNTNDNHNSNGDKNIKLSFTQNIIESTPHLSSMTTETSTTIETSTNGNLKSIIEMNKVGRFKIGQIHGHFHTEAEANAFIRIWSEGTRGTISKAARGEILAKHMGK